MKDGELTESCFFNEVLNGCRFESAHSTKAGYLARISGWIACMSVLIPSSHALSYWRPMHFPNMSLLYIGGLPAPLTNGNKNIGGGLKNEGQAGFWKQTVIFGLTIS